MEVKIDAVALSYDLIARNYWNIIFMNIRKTMIGN